MSARAADEPEIYRYPLSHCPACGHTIDAAASLRDGRGPKEGDVAVCLKCAEPAIFTAELGLRAPTEAERAELLADPDTLEHMAAVRHRAYKNRRFSERRCDKCGKPYRGPAVYCSFECAMADA